MPRTVSAPAIASLFSQETSDVWLRLLTISGPNFTTFRVCANTQDIVSNGNTFKAFPFKIEMPGEPSDQQPKAKLIISNVSREITAGIRAVKSATASLSFARASSPNTIELGPFDFDVEVADIDAMSITFTLGFEPILSEPFPAQTMRNLFPKTV